MEIFNRRSLVSLRDDYTDEELNLLMEKYKEKQLRYNKMMNEATERNDKIILHINNEMVRRFVNKNLDKKN